MWAESASRILFAGPEEEERQIGEELRLYPEVQMHPIRVREIVVAFRHIRYFGIQILESRKSSTTQEPISGSLPVLLKTV